MENVLKRPVFHAMLCKINTRTSTLRTVNKHLNIFLPSFSLSSLSLSFCFSFFRNIFYRVSFITVVEEMIYKLVEEMIYYVENFLQKVTWRWAILDINILLINVLFIKKAQTYLWRVFLTLFQVKAQKHCAAI